MTQSSRTEAASSKRGMILVIVLWTLAIMTVVAVALSAYVQRNIGAAGSDMQRLRSDMALQSGVNAAAALIFGVKDGERIFLDGVTRRIDLGGGRIIDVSLTEATGRADLNLADAALLEAIFVDALQSKAAGKSMAGAVMELRNRLVPPKKKDGKQAAEEEKPVASAPVFQSPAQLLSLKGLNPADIAKVLPYIGVLSREGRINPLTAPDVVLRSVPGLTGRDFAALRDARKNHDASSDAVKAIVEKYAKFMSLDQGRAFLVTARIVGGPGLIAGSRIAASVLLSPEAPKPFQVLAWSW